MSRQICSHTPRALNAGAKRSGRTCHMAMPQCCYLAKGAKRPSHTTNTINFYRIPFDPCNSIKKFDLCPFDQKNPTYLQPPVSKHVVSVLRNIWPPALLYTNQVLMFLHSTARSADILNPSNLAIIPQHINIVRLFLVHKLSIVNRDPVEIKAMYIQYARQSSVSTFKKEVRMSIAGTYGNKK